MSRLGTHMQDATRRLGAGTVLTHRAPGTGLGGKNNFHAFSCPAHARTDLPLWAGGLMFVPIDREVREIEAFAGFGLPTTVRHSGTYQLDPLLRAFDQQRARPHTQYRRCAPLA